MKTPVLISVAALMTFAAAQSSGDVVSDPALIINNVGFVPHLDDVVVDIPSIDLANYDAVMDLDDADSRHGYTSRFIAWSSPGFKGHQQSTKNTEGCHILDDGAVGSYQGSNNIEYGFFEDRRCRGKMVYGWKTGSEKRIRPIIYPRSVKIRHRGADDDGDHGNDRPMLRTLVTWERPMFSGDNQKIHGKGCQSLNGNTIMSFQGQHVYKFYARRHCSGKVLLESRGGMSRAKIYQEEGDLQTSYILYMRFCNLVVSGLSKHGEYTNPDYKAALLMLKKSAVVAMNEIEAMKPILERKYKDYQEYIRQREELRLAQTRDAQFQYGVQQQQQQQQQQKQKQGMSRSSKELQDMQWANNPPAPGWSLAKALEGVPGTNTSLLNHPTPTSQSQLLIPTPSGPPPALPRKPVSANNAPKLPPKILIEEDVHEYSQGLRTMIVPIRLLDRFLNIVRPNTIKKLETCGILAGVLSRNKLTVTTLIIPKQTATSDTCSTTNEDELFEFQSQRDLMTLGWIHTHPTQTCFMSSVDLHTHCSYQLMLPEAIAIVCAPSHDKDYGVFRLTDPPGLQVITNCRQTQLFHQHPGENDIYTDACDQGHVELKDIDLDIVDLRKK
ncbi:hypothetical protein BGZ51_002449 [Haplosporangium sp. Z 767]|nr:hypothetical protein BGZ50_003806 [Haplosporangium sp. Z 11]KAF9185805.1 hypothetical protein BGZ51_002449 [Haplosporangium sp. Z 767]